MSTDEKGSFSEYRLLHLNGMVNRSLETCFDDLNTSDSRVILSVPFSLNHLILIVDTWLKQNEENDISKLWYDQNTFGKQHPLPLALIDKSDCESNHKEPVYDVGGRLRCAHTERRGFRVVPTCYSFILSEKGYQFSLEKILKRFASLSTDEVTNFPTHGLVVAQSVEAWYEQPIAGTAPLREFKPYSFPRILTSKSSHS